MEQVYDLKVLTRILGNEPGVLVYFSSESCSVCKVLRPKVKELIEERFPAMRTLYVDIEKSPVLSGQHRIFTIPTILIFFEGRESHRFSRNIGIDQLVETMEKPYRLLFDPADSTDPADPTDQASPASPSSN